MFSREKTVAKPVLSVLSISLLVTVACLLSAPVTAQPKAPGEAGLWIDHTGRGVVEIKPCGDSLCGRIAWVKAGLPTKDAQGRKLCGLQIIGDVKRQSDGSWDNGWIYRPDDDGKFSLQIKLTSPDRLQILGYLGMKMLGETYVWKRAPADQPRCS
jgi:uncharacterized protein (DUF2147 family)